MQAIAGFAAFSRSHPGQVVSMSLMLDDIRLHATWEEHPWLVEIGGIEQLEQCTQAFSAWAEAARIYCVSELGGFSFWIGDPQPGD